MISLAGFAVAVECDPLSMDRLFQENMKLRLKVNAFLNFHQRRSNLSRKQERLCENRQFYVVRQNRSGLVFNYRADNK